MKQLPALFAICALFTNAAMAASIPACLDSDGLELPINNDTVIEWKRSTPNAFKKRAHIQGVVSEIYADRIDVQNSHSNHHHFQLKLDTGQSIEIVFNDDFGKPLRIEEGATVEVCGDYITSKEQTGPYPASPDGAIVHWVHRSPHPSRHADGFLVVDGILFGF